MSSPAAAGPSGEDEQEHVMSRYAERARGVILKKIDVTKIEQDAVEVDWWKEKFPDSQAEVWHQPWAVAEVGDAMYVVCNEGVGYEVKDEPTRVFDVAACKRNDAGQKTGYSMFPAGEVKVTKDEVRAMATDEEIDLADLVRSFGQRLEDNFWAWHATLTDKAGLPR